MLITVNKLIQREQPMLNQFCNNLQAIIHRLTEIQGEPSESLVSLEKHLHEEQSWPAANQVELALVDFYDETTLVTEWQRRLAEIDSLPLTEMNFYKEHSEERDVPKLRSLLCRLVSDLQWLRESERVIRLNESLMRRKIIGLFLISFLLFFTPTLVRAFFGFEFENLRLYYLFTAASAGLLGASFSLLTSIQSRIQAATLEQVKAMNQAGYILARAMVGAGAGLIMFYLVQSGLLAGEFFPKFIQNVEEIEKYQSEFATTAEQATVNVRGVSQSAETLLAVGTLAQPAKGLSVLIVWCLLAGFAEKLIPGILSSKAKAAEKSSAD